MKRKYLFLITTILLGQTCVMQAQTDNHITVTNDKTGKKEVIELPEAMTYNLENVSHPGYKLQHAERQSDILKGCLY